MDRDRDRDHDRGRGRWPWPAHARAHDRRGRVLAQTHPPVQEVRRRDSQMRMA